MTAGPIPSGTKWSRARTARRLRPRRAWEHAVVEAVPGADPTAGAGRQSLLHPRFISLAVQHRQRTGGQPGHQMGRPLSRRRGVYTFDSPDDPGVGTTKPWVGDD